MEPTSYLQSYLAKLTSGSEANPAVAAASAVAGKIVGPEEVLR